MKGFFIRGLVLPFLVATIVLTGCDKGDESVAKKAGTAIGQQLTDFTKGVGSGIDQQMMVQVALSPEVHALGLTNTIAKSLGLESSHKGFSVYLIASRSVSNTVIARALDAKNTEVGRSKKQIVMEQNDASYITFEFDAQMDSAMVKSYSIGF